MTQLGFVGLGKMGGNMVHRIHRDSDHQVVAFDYNDQAVQAAAEHGATGVHSLEDLVARLDAPVVPHMGWNDLVVTGAHPVLEGVAAGDHAGERPRAGRRHGRLPEAR